jgi:peptidyl-prolyl cis-trans isomerase C
MAAYAAEPPLASGTVPGVGEVRIDAADVGSDILRIPVDVRPQVLTQPRTMKQLVTNLYTRRALAQRGEAQGLDKLPEVAAALALARDKVLSDALLVQVDKGNTPPDDKVEALARTMYQANAKDFQQPERVRIRHILIAVKDKDDATAAKQAQEVLAQLRAGGDFAALAKQYSADPGSADKGGDLGFFAQGGMVPEFDQVAFTLRKPGELSDLVKTQFGYHILQLQERKPAGQQPFEDVKDALVAKVKQGEQQKGRVALAEQLESTMKLDEAAVKAAFEKLVPTTAPTAPAKP